MNRIRGQQNIMEGPTDAELLLQPLAHTLERIANMAGNPETNAVQMEWDLEVCMNSKKHYGCSIRIVMERADCLEH